MSLLVVAVADAEEYHVAFVSLHVLEVLHEETFQAVFFEEGFKVRLFFESAVDGFLNRIHLGYAEGYDAEGFLRVVFEVFKDEVCDFFGFFEVVSCASAVVDAVGYVD